VTDIDDRIREHYRGQTLPNGAVSRLVEQAAISPSSQSFWTRAIDVVRGNALQLGLAACLMVVVSSTVHQYGVHSERTELALKEVAMNHFTRLDLEYIDTSISTIDKEMALLPFELSLPKSVAENYQIKGARYCTLSGQLAAHVKLTHQSTKKPLSVFMTRAADELNAIDDSQESIDGVDVRIWRESGLLFAMVGSYEARE